MKIYALFLSLLLAVFVSGCSTTGSNATSPQWHGVFYPAKKNHPPIHWYDKVNPVWWVGNCDEPIPPSWYAPSNNLGWRKFKWQFSRNPFANFAQYVIGVADKDIHRYGKYPESAGNPHGGWNFTITRWKFLFFPFIDYQSHKPGEDEMEFYLGWRIRGDFGIAFRHNPPDKAHRKK